MFALTHLLILVSDGKLVFIRINERGKTLAGVDLKSQHTPAFQCVCSCKKVTKMNYVRLFSHLFFHS